MRYADIGYNPPAPVSLVAIRGNHPLIRVENVPMLVDTGAEVSLVPLSVIRTLGLKATPEPSLRLSSFNGNVSAADVVVVGIDFCDKLFEGKYVVLDAPVGIIGRDILNELRVEFDGPALEWKVIPSQA